jgi:SnoaL-like domain
VSGVDAGAASQILEVLARYAHVVDNRDWDDAAGVFSADVQVGAGPQAIRGVAGFRELVGTAPATHGHNTTDVILDARPDGSVRAWSKFFIVRGDGTIGSGDYQDTLVQTPAGWRISRRDVSRGNRLDTDPTGGPSRRSFSFATWLDGPAAD